MGQITRPPSAPAADDLPPTYDEALSNLPIPHPTTTTTPASRSNDPLSSPPETAYFVPNGQRYNSIFPSKHQTGTVSLNSTLSEDPSALEEFIERQTKVPPRPCLAIKGVHTETRSHRKESKSQTVTDFDFQIDLTRTILRWDAGEETGPATRWSYTTVVADGDGQKAYRGGRWRSRTRGSGRIKLPESDEEERLVDMEEDEQAPGLAGWCERFCKDPAPVKSFTYTRTLDGFDAAPMRSSLTGHLRSLNYRGTIYISPSLSSGIITIYSPHWINRLRNNTFVFWFCIIFQLWIITWPVIWFMERRYEVVRSAWFSSKYVCDTPEVPPANGLAPARRVFAGGHNEASVAEMWAPVVMQAAWERRQGGDILTDQEVQRLRQTCQLRTERMGPVDELLNRGQMMLGLTQGISWGMDEWGGSSSSSSLTISTLPTGGGRQFNLSIR